MSRYVAYYTCGYCGCDEEWEFNAESYEEAEARAVNALGDYASRWYPRCARDIPDVDDYDTEEEYEAAEEESYDAFYEGCCVEVVPYDEEEE